MIFSSLNVVPSFDHYPASIRTALEFLKTADIEAMEIGDHPIDGTNIYAKVFDLTTMAVEDTSPEVHKDCIDVQFWPSGSERFGIAPYLGDEKVVKAMVEADTYFLESVKDESFVTATPGCFAVFFPWDAHRPGTVLGEKATFRKCVVKVALSTLK